MLPARSLAVGCDCPCHRHHPRAIIRILSEAGAAWVSVVGDGGRERKPASAGTGATQRPLPLTAANLKVVVGSSWKRRDDRASTRIKGRAGGKLTVGEMARREEDGLASEFAASAFDVVAMAASAGGLRALTEVLSSLPRKFPAAIVVVQHLDRRHRSLMAEILDRSSDLPVKQAAAGDLLRRGTVFIAPPDNHLLVDPDGVLSLSKSELVHFVRPSADLLFESVAASYRERAIAVVLTGSGSDGSLGAAAVKKMGGTVIAQDEATSDFSDMPNAAVRTGAVDLVLPLNAISSALVSLVAAGATR